MDNGMVYLPSYYREFTCTANRCEDNCCRGGWIIEIDEKTNNYYQTLQGEWGERLRSSLDIDEDGDVVFKLENNQCPHLDDNGLCNICINLGVSHMGLVCKEFPRFTNIMGAYVEKGIGLACEEAARIILYNRQGLEIIGTEPELVGFDTNDLIEDDVEYVDELLALREKLINIVESNNLCLDDKLKNVLIETHKYQHKLNDSFDEKSHVEALESIKDMDMSDVSLSESLLDIYAGLEILNASWEKMCSDTRKNLHYENISKEEHKEKILSIVCNMDDGELVFENLLKYLLFRYIPKAYEDYNVIDKVRFIVSYYIVIREMLTGLYLSSGEKLSQKQVITLVKDFSRQVEYSEENVESIYEEFLFGENLKI